MRDSAAGRNRGREHSELRTFCEGHSKIDLDNFPKADRFVCRIARASMRRRHVVHTNSMNVARDSPARIFAPIVRLEPTSSAEKQRATTSEWKQKRSHD